MNEILNAVPTEPPTMAPTEPPVVVPPPEPFVAWEINADGLIINYVRVDSLTALPGRRLVDAAIGGRLGDSIEFGEDGQPVLVPAVPVELPRVIPERVSMRQARLALLEAELLDSVDAAIIGMPGVDGQAARIEWDYSQEVWREKPLVAMMAQALNLTAEQLDDLFFRAGQL